MSKTRILGGFKAYPAVGSDLSQDAASSNASLSGAPSEACFPEEMRTREAVLIGERRAKAFGRAEKEGSPDVVNVGLALSGGGIRSATISLGLLQALASLGLLKRFDYLSTVSGGGYIGGFLGGLYIPRSDATGVAHPGNGGDSTKVPETQADRVSATLKDPAAFETSWLRENGRYLAPAGASDAWAGFAVVLRSLVAIYIVLGVALLTLFLAAYALRVGTVESVKELLGPFGLFKILRALGERHLSAWILLWAIASLIWAIPSGLAYWALPNEVSEDGPGRRGLPPVATLLIATAGTLGAALLVWKNHTPLNGGWFIGVLGLSICIGIGFIAVVLSLLARVMGAHEATKATPSGQSKRGPRESTAGMLAARDQTTRWLRSALLACTALAVFALVDSLAEWLYGLLTDDNLKSFFVLSGSVLSAMLAAGALLQKVLGLLGGQHSTKPIRVSYRVIAAIAAALLALGILTILDTMGQGLARGWSHKYSVAPWWLYPNLAAGIGLTVILGQTFPFLNRSSLSSLYAARLTRAYLGASNLARRNESRRNITQLLPGDVIPFSEYRPHEHGGPLHIMNVTLNETVDGKSQLEERDRRGMNLAIGPAGISVAARHHALWKKLGSDTPAPWTGLEAIPSPGKAFSIFAPGSSGAPVPESLQVGQWMAVSGAAVSTALGSRTSIGLSLLLGLLNARLGRWWDSGTSPPRRLGSRRSLSQMVGQAFAGALPVQAHLFDELLARFHGVAQRFWYLTDGGHFENTAAYELIRRRVPIIVLCDNGADVGGKFADLGNLVEKARTDFHAEVDFLDIAGVERLKNRVRERSVGTLAELGFAGSTDSVSETNYAAVANIWFPGGDRSLLILLKPRMTVSLPVDVRVYHEQADTFPQQSTADQFFDEAQWESYRMLGFVMGIRVFGEPNGTAPANFWPSEALKVQPDHGSKFQVLPRNSAEKETYDGEQAR